MVYLGVGVHALAIDIFRQERQIVWVEGGVYFKVVGSEKTFSAEDALSVARTVAAAAASG